MLAQLTAALANANRDPKQKPSPFTPDDFLPKWYESEEDRDARLTASLELAMPKTPRRGA